MLILMKTYFSGVANMNTADLINEAVALPLEQRALVVESLLNSLNPADSDIENQWLDVANKRLSEVRSGKVETVDGQAVFDKVKQKYQQL